VCDLIPTPQNDACEPACSAIESVKDDSKKKGSKGKAQSDSSVLFIDKDWVAEHARQVQQYYSLYLHFIPFFFFHILCSNYQFYEMEFIVNALLILYVDVRVFLVHSQWFSNFFIS
jgi:hypothetical protein